MYIVRIIIKILIYFFTYVELNLLFNVYNVSINDIQYDFSSMFNPFLNLFNAYNTCILFYVSILKGIIKLHINTI